MKKYRIITVVGARPQFIKAAPLSRILAKTPEIEEILVHTGQHYDYAMSQQFFEELGLPTPQYNLEVGSARAAVQIAQIIAKFDAVLEKEKPDLVVVFGDTNSTAAAAIAAAKNNLPIAHVEAGLRENNKNAPEEANKLLTDAVTDFFFCPTQTGVANLAKQGITKNVFLSGDIGIDLIVHESARIAAQKAVFENHQITEGSYFFVTCHRAANTDNPQRLEQILLALSALEESVVFALHPRTEKMIQQYNLEHFLHKKNNIKLIQPQGFINTQALIKNAKMVLTDSGGIIKEAYFHQTPCVVIDAQSEWIEAVEEGWSRIAGADATKIGDAIAHFGTPSVQSHFLGTGNAARIIVDSILEFLKD